MWFVGIQNGAFAGYLDSDVCGNIHHGSQGEQSSTVFQCLFCGSGQHDDANRQHLKIFDSVGECKAALRIGDSLQSLQPDFVLPIRMRLSPAVGL